MLSSPCSSSCTCTHDAGVYTSQPITLPTTPPTLQSSLAEEQPAGNKAAGPPGRLQLHRTSSPESIQTSDHDTSTDPRRRQQASSGLHDYDHSSERWVPYRHTNGVAIYYHSSNGRARSDGQRGEEYMASTIIKGTPQECLDVLINSGSHTTILGPASHIRVLEQESDSQVSLQGCRNVLQALVAGTSHGSGPCMRCPGQHAHRCMLPYDAAPPSMPQWPKELCRRRLAAAAAHPDRGDRNGAQAVRAARGGRAARCGAYQRARHHPGHVWQRGGGGGRGASQQEEQQPVGQASARHSARRLHHLAAGTCAGRA